MRKTKAIQASTYTLIFLLTTLPAQACQDSPGPTRPSVMNVPGSNLRVTLSRGVQMSGGNQLKEGVVQLLFRMAKAAGKNVEVTSGFRSCGHNARVGGVSKSQHLLGNAVDFNLPGADYNSAQLANIARRIGAGGAGVYCSPSGGRKEAGGLANYSHMDTGRRRDWNWCRNKSLAARYGGVAADINLRAGGQNTGDLHNLDLATNGYVDDNKQFNQQTVAAAQNNNDPNHDTAAWLLLAASGAALFIPFLPHGGLSGQ
jgi:hypothetical protein